jgi:hypothetical protein
MLQLCGNGDADNCTDWLTPSPCPPGESCDEGACTPIVTGCLTADDCLGGFTCAMGVCVGIRPCVDSSDCAVGELCDGVTRRCTPSGDGRVGDHCAVDAECFEGAVCSTGSADGYCTAGCGAGRACQGGATCYLLDPTDQTSGACLRDCATHEQCEARQACFPAAGPFGGACFPVECTISADCDSSDGLRQVRCEDGRCIYEDECDLTTGLGCGAGETCIGEQGTGVCVPTCEVFGSACPAATDHCVPLGIATSGVCIPAGPGRDGASCVSQFECAAGHYCSGDALGNGHCLPVCNTTAADGCPAGSACISQLGDVGVCVEDCESDCAAGAVRCVGAALQGCEQVDDDLCLDWGTAVSCGAGEGCDEMTGSCRPACGSDADCGNVLVPARCVSGNCTVESECDPATGADCPAPGQCFVANAAGTAGVCLETCDALGDRQCSVAGESCLLFASIAVCGDAGGGGDGAGCESSADCAAGLACVGEANGPVCRLVCDVSDNDPSCPAGDRCFDLGIDTRLGLCVDDCTDECVAGTQQCDQSAGTQTCGDFDADVCAEWSTTTPCEDGTTCDPQTSTCRIFCDEDLDCPQGEALDFVCDLATNRCEVESCTVGGGGAGCDPGDLCLAQDFTAADMVGYCLDACSALGQDCPTPDGNCTWYPTSDSTAEFVCLPAGTGTSGDPCDFLVDCAEGFSCIPLTTGQVCLGLCDRRNPRCPGGLECAEVPFFPAGSNAGVCL